MNYLLNSGVVKKLDDFFYVFYVVVGITDNSDSHRFLVPQNNKPASSRLIILVSRDY